MSRRFTAILWAESGGFVSLSPELDIASQGDTLSRRAKSVSDWRLRLQSLTKTSSR